MSYPPQPGWDPNQQQPDPYGQPNQQQPDPYGQPPVDPYGQPPADPYAPPGAAPGFDPYNAPASGMPMSGMPNMAPMGVPQPQKSNTGWIVGGIVGVVVILLAVGGILFATGTLGGDDDGSGNDDKTGEADASDDEGGDNTGGGELTGTYQAIPEICDTIDMSGFDVLGSAGTYDQGTGEGATAGSKATVCQTYFDGADYSNGYSLSIGAAAFEGTEGAKGAFQDALEYGNPISYDFSFYGWGDCKHEPVDGDWDQAEVSVDCIAVYDDSAFTETQTVIFMAVHGNMVVAFHLVFNDADDTGVDPPAADADISAAMKDAAVELFKASAA